MSKDNNDYKNKKQEALNKSLKSTRVYEAKGSFVDLVDTDSYPLLKVLHAELPTVDGTEITKYSDYISQYIERYNAYLGFDSGLDANAIINVIDANIELLCATLILKRYYDSKNYESPRGHIIKDKLGNVVTTVRYSGSTTVVNSQERISDNLKKISNASWISDYIDECAEVILPPNVASFYMYYLSNYFDITDSGNNESLVILTFWPTLDGEEFTLGHPDNWSNMQLNALKFQTIANRVRTLNTSRVKDFCKRFLEWWSPTDLDLTRDIQGNSVNICRDLGLIDQFNNIIPTKCKVFTSAVGDTTNGIYPNTSERLYYDFELPYSFDVNSSQEFDDRPALAYYYTMRQEPIKDMLLTKTEELENGVILDFNYMILSSVFTETEASYLNGGTVLSTLTLVNMLTGQVEYVRSHIQQIAIGDDLSLSFNNKVGTPIDESTLPILLITGIIGDYNEAPEVKNELAIFRYSFDLQEWWDLYSNSEVFDPSTPMIVSKVDVSFLNKGNIYDQFWKNIHGICFKLGTSDTDAARQASMFRWFTTLFYTYQESANYIDNLFDGKQQSNKD